MSLSLASLNEWPSGCRHLKSQLSIDWPHSLHVHHTQPENYKTVSLTILSHSKIKRFTRGKDSLLPRAKDIGTELCPQSSTESHSLLSIHERYGSPRSMPHSLYPSTEFTDKSQQHKQLSTHRICRTLDSSSYRDHVEFGTLR